MKAVKIYSRKLIVPAGKNRRIVISMDLFRLPKKSIGYPEGYKFSWIAFDPEDPTQRVLFDCHPPKGPHFHIDEEVEGQSYEWKNLIEAQKDFVLMIEKRSGKLIEGELS